MPELKTRGVKVRMCTSSLDITLFRPRPTSRQSPCPRSYSFFGTVARLDTKKDAPAEREAGRASWGVGFVLGCVSQRGEYSSIFTSFETELTPAGHNLIRAPPNPNIHHGRVPVSLVRQRRAHVLLRVYTELGQ